MKDKHYSKSTSAFLDFLVTDATFLGFPNSLTTQRLRQARSITFRHPRLQIDMLVAILASWLFMLQSRALAPATAKCNKSSIGATHFCFHAISRSIPAISRSIPAISRSIISTKPFVKNPLLVFVTRKKRNHSSAPKNGHRRRFDTHDGDLPCTTPRKQIDHFDAA